MAIRFRCDHCRQLMSIATRMAGREVPCPKCREVVRVPEEDEGASSMAAPPAAAGGLSGTARGESHGARPESAAPSVPAPSSQPPVPSSPSPDDDEPPVRFRRRGMHQEELDMTPLVDVTFLLLIFFMVTATFGRQKTLQVPPPDSDKKGAAQAVQQIRDVLETSLRVRVDARNVVSIEDEKIGDLSQLAGRLQERKRIELKTEAVVEIDPRALHETVVRVIDACNEAGMQKIRLSGKAEGN